MRIVPHLPIIVLAAFAIACRETNGPIPVPSAYVARAVHGLPLPAPIIQGEDYQMIMVADTLRLFPLGVAWRSLTYQQKQGSVLSPVQVSRWQNEFAIRGDSIFILQYCPPNALCTAPPRGIFSDDRRTLTLGVWGTEPLVRYTLVEPD
jgi:hypothetical protein